MATRGRSQLSYAQPAAAPAAEQDSDVNKGTTHQLSELELCNNYFRVLLLIKCAEYHFSKS